MAKFEKVETYVIPRYLYRYRSLQQFNREMDCIKQAYLYCANFVQMNDPMEGFYSESKLLEKARDIGGIRAAIASRKTMIGMCAFSEVFNHELMWAHYADQFRGICITYDFFKLRHNLPAGTSFSRIYYNEEVPKVGLSKNKIIVRSRRQYFPIKIIDGCTNVNGECSPIKAKSFIRSHDVSRVFTSDHVFTKSNEARSKGGLGG